ncbi:MAG: copper-binding protein [Methylocystis sp.]
MKTMRLTSWLVGAGVAVSFGIGGASANSPVPEAPGFVIVQAAETADKTTGQGDGVVRAVDADERRIMITHGPVSGPLEMSPMTMAFRVAPNVDLSSLSKGMKIKFTISRDAKGLYVIENVQPEKP